ncbi:MAG: 4a-hydroxytetrahydrobiopterin dehydratase [Gammaproteobacteria bacterium]|nr:4a-hydroxytetrahydrobiopterin dehydratase [Gammaproteobacteria bacterium]
MHPNSLPTLPEATVQQRLSEELPHWTLEGGWIRRKYRTSGWKASLILVNTIGHLAEVAWHHPDLSVTYAMVIVKLMTHSAKGITERDLALAKKIEEVIQWQPLTLDSNSLKSTLVERSLCLNVSPHLQWC